MAIRYERQKAANNYTGIELYTPYCFREFNQHRIEARRYRVQISSPIEGRVAANTPYGTIYHHVNLQLKHCTYYAYQEIDIPCSHAFALILQLNYQHPHVFLPQFLSFQAWQNTYSSNLCPIAFDATGSAEHQPPHNYESPLNLGDQPLPCIAPRTRVPRGRPKKERYRLGEARQHIPGAQNHLCSTCGQQGHNSRTCRTPHD